MRTKDIINAVKAHLASASPAIPMAWPNVAFDIVLPYVEVSFPALSWRNVTLAGGSEARVATGTLSAIVVGEIDRGEDAVADLQDQIAAMFEAGTRLPLAGGQITINLAPDIRAGFKDGAHWRAPVIVQFTADPAPA